MAQLNGAEGEKPNAKYVPNAPRISESRQAAWTKAVSN
jgi:hypothetical protein